MKNRRYPPSARVFQQPVKKLRILLRVMLRIVSSTFSMTTRKMSTFTLPAVEHKAAQQERQVVITAFSVS
jgi:hypothetical protein